MVLLNVFIHGLIWDAVRRVKITKDGWDLFEGIIGTFPVCVTLFLNPHDGSVMRAKLASRPPG